MATRRSFEFRMSKKVAELTQVVHLLFVTNHEHELELDALRDAYEHEIDIVMADATDRLETLRRQLEDREEELAEERNWRIQGEEDQKKIQSLENTLEEERVECQKIRDLLVLSQKDIEVLRTRFDAAKSKHDSEVREKNTEIDQLKLRISDLERLDRCRDSQSSQQTESLRDLVDKMQRQVLMLREELANSESDRNALLARYRNLEDDVNILKRELASRRSVQKDADEGAKQPATIVKANSFPRKPNYEREIQQLRQEIQRYRMELSNREINFNRRFADVQPVKLNRRSVSVKKSRDLNTDRFSLLQTDRFSDGPLNEPSYNSSSAHSVSSSFANEATLPRIRLKRPQLEKPQPYKLLTAKKSH